jgi:hypothetical protein
MACEECANGKWKQGATGSCMFESKAKCEAARGLNGPAVSGPHAAPADAAPAVAMSIQGKNMDNQDPMDTTPEPMDTQDVPVSQDWHDPTCQCAICLKGMPSSYQC